MEEMNIIEEGLGKSDKFTQNIEQDENIIKELPLLKFLEYSQQPFAAGYDNGTIAYYNQAFCELLGYSKKELSTKKWDQDLTVDKWIVKESPIYKNLFPANRPINIKKVLIDKNGREIVVDISGQCLYKSEDKILFYGFFKDITEQEKFKYDLEQKKDFLYKLVKERTREINDAYRKLKKEETENKRLSGDLNHFFNLSPDIFCAIDFDCNIKKINSSVVDLLSYSPKEVINQGLSFIVYKDDIDKTLEYIKNEIVKKNGHHNFINRLNCKDGGYRWIEWNGASVNEEELCYFVGRDITERKKMDKEMIRMEQLNLVGQIAAGIGHEVRNPLTTVKGFLQIMQNKGKCDEYKDYFNLLIDELDRANSIITEFLSMAKNKPRKLERENLNSIIKALAPLIRADAIRYDMFVNIELGEIADLYLDQKEIRQLILNFVRNGLEAMKPGGHITIRTKKSKGKDILSIQDEGGGIPKDVIDKIGTPFFTTKKEGTGLGLATCFSIADRHNASIDIDTNSHGTTFNIIF